MQKHNLIFNIHRSIKYIMVVCLFTQGCMIGNVGYSFKGTSIPTGAFTFFIDDFDNQTTGAPPTLPQTFREALNDKIRNESRLKNNDENPDIEFTGAVSNYSVRAEAPQSGQTAAFNRLTITVRVEYLNNLNPDDTWKKNFSHQADFETNENLIDVQDNLITIILDELVDRVFNEAFTNW